MSSTAVPVPGASRWHRFKSSLTPAEWRRAAVLFAVIALLHAIGLFLLFAFVVPHHFALGGASGVFGVGVGITAYTLGMRHAFDADHIAAIDNTTRKLMTDGQRPLSVGFFFSLGHSTIVFVLASLFASACAGSAATVAERRLDAAQGDRADRPDASPARSCSHRDPQPGHPVRHREGLPADAPRRATTRQELEHQLNSRGLMNRFYGRATRAVKQAVADVPARACCSASASTPRPRSRCSATAGAAAAGGLPFYAILCLPILFAAGMSLLDTIDGAFMNFAYGWAFSKPVRKVFYNITITALSVAVALLIGTIELLAGPRGQAQPGRRRLRLASTTSTSTSSATSSSGSSSRPGHRPVGVAPGPHRGEVVGQPAARRPRLTRDPSA